MLKIAPLALAAVFTASTASAASVDLKASTLKWHGSKVVGGAHYGQVSLKSAEIDGDTKSFRKATFVVDMNSLTVGDLKGEWADKLRGHLMADDFFAVAKHPTARLELGAGKNGKAKGKLTVRGKTKPINVTFTRAGADRVTGTMVFNRTDFGVNYGSGSIFKSLVADKVIKDEIKIEFDVRIVSGNKSKS